MFGALPGFLVPQSLSCLTPPAKPVSVADTDASSNPLNDQPLTSVVAVRYGAVPVQSSDPEAGSKLFQSKPPVSGARLPSAASKPESPLTEP